MKNEYGREYSNVSLKLFSFLNFNYILQSPHLPPWEWFCNMWYDFLQHSNLYSFTGYFLVTSGLVWGLFFFNMTDVLGHTLPFFFFLLSNLRNITYHYFYDPEGCPYVKNSAGSKFRPALLFFQVPVILMDIFFLNSSN